MEPDFTPQMVVQIFRPADGYVLRVWEDGRVSRARGSEAEETLQPYDPTLQYPEVKGRFVKAQRETWGAALSAPIAPGPHGPSGRVPQVGEPIRQALVFRAWQDGAVVTAELEADLRVAATLGPLQAAYEALTKRVFPPRK